MYTSILDPLPLKILATSLAMMEQQTEYNQKAKETPLSKRTK